MRTLVGLLIIVNLGLVGCGQPETLVIVTPTVSAIQPLEPTMTALPTATSEPTLVAASMSTLNATATEVPTTQDVQSNSDWQPTVETFDGIDMVYVPTGCFEMGSIDDFANEDETPVHPQCIDEPFWLDRTEVTNTQFGSVGMFRGPDLPRDTVTLPQASTFCASRGGRLPTEVEWEWAARGPDNLRYPWGNSFEEGRALYSLNAVNETKPVGLYPDGASWVGALDMSGSLWEWTSTIYAYQYPYDADDGRENPDDDNNFRAIRGGAFSTDAFFLRTTSRKQKHPTLEYLVYVGFRCVLPVN